MSGRRNVVVDLVDSPLDAPRARAGQNEAGTSARAGAGGSSEPGRRLQSAASARQGQASTSGRQAPVVDLLADDDDDVVVVQYKPGTRSPPPSTQRKRPRSGAGPGGASGAAAGAEAGRSPSGYTAHQQAALARHQPPAPVAPPSPERYKCPVCLDKMENMASTPCGHVFCEPCLVSCIKSTKKCPKCRKAITLKQVHRIYLD